MATHHSILLHSHIIHAKDDEIVYMDTSVEFAKKLGCKITLLQRGGHLSLSCLLKTRFWRRVDEFIDITL